MPYRRGNFSYVIDSSFTPFTLQEMLVPFAAYKDAYGKAEESYNELSTKAGDFKYLSEQMPEGSEAKAIYEGYANELQSQAEDLSRNGLTAMNRGALTSLKRRFSGEIGTLQKAEAALKEYQKVRDAMDVQDSTGIYASETPTIDDFLPGKNFNRYRVSGKELYAAGAAASKAITSRMFGTEDGEKILQGQFLNFVQKNGMSPEAIERFRNDMSTNPALQNAIEGIAQQYGLYENLKDNSLERAKKSIINGVIDNAVYQVTNSPQKNLDYITPVEQHTMNLQDKEDARKQEEHRAKMEDREYENTLKYTFGTDEKGRKIVTGYNLAGVQAGYGRDPLSGKPRKIGKDEKVDPTTGVIVQKTEDDKEDDKSEKDKDKESESLLSALGSLKKDAFSKNGFDVTYSNGKKHKTFTWAGAIVNHSNGNISVSKFGDDLEGRTGPSSSSLSNWIGDARYPNTNNGMRVITVDESAKLLFNNNDFTKPTELGRSLREYLKKNGIDMEEYADRISLVEVPNPNPNSKRKDYLIAISDE